MKLIVLALAALVAVVLAAPAEQEIKILRSDFDKQADGGYSYGIETENGIKQSEEGQVKTVNDEENKPHEVVVVRGSYSYNDNEGKPHSFNYYADETGFHVEGDDVPKSP